MAKIRALWRNLFDVREGERLRTLFMSLYFLFALFSYYILKPASRALFLNKFDIDKLPYLYILIAAAGGLMAYGYTKIALKVSLQAAVTWSTAIIVGCLFGLWWLVGLGLTWVFYAFNIWVSLFPVIMVAQGWLVSANVFNPREAKRLYGLIGMGSVLGAALGGEFAAIVVKFTGTRNLIPASAIVLVLAYLSFRLVLVQKGVSLAGARGAEAEEIDFSLGEIITAMGRYRHLQVIIAIMTLQFIVDTTIDFQFNAMAKKAFHGDQLTAFLGNFYGPYLSVLTVILQLFFTTLIVRRIGVGGTLQIMPVTVALSSLSIYFAPSVYSAGAVRLAEASTRYTVNRTGLELLYLPLPTDLKNRTKAFIDVFVDRMARGLGGMLLVLFTTVWAIKQRNFALVTMTFAAMWIILSWRASREYVATVRKRLASRRLDLESARVNVSDPATLQLLEQTALGDNPRQAAYALSLLAEARGYPLDTQLRKLTSSPHPEVRAKVYDLARSAQFNDALEPAMREIEAAASSGEAEPAVKAAVRYALAVSPEAHRLAKEFLAKSDPVISEGAVEAMVAHPEIAQDVITHEWISKAANDSDAQRRALAASAIGVAGDQGTEALHKLLEDPDARVAGAACRAAGALQNRAYLYALVRRLSDPHLRGLAIDSLAAYGPKVCGALSDILEDASTNMAIRRQIPRVLKKIVHQRSVDVLVLALRHRDLPLRGAILKALNRLRESDPKLNYANDFISEEMMKEARYYFEMNAALAPFRDQTKRLPVTSLLARTIEERLRQTLERMFRLLGLRYPPTEIYSAYLAVNRKRGEQASAALEFLDNVLVREHKRIVLPLLDEPDNVMETGKSLFGIQRKDTEAAVRDLIRSGDTWLVACAMGTAAELKIRKLAPDITEAAQAGNSDVAQVGESAAAALV